VLLYVFVVKYVFTTTPSIFHSKWGLNSLLKTIKIVIKMKKIAMLFIALTTLMSCEKVIEIDLNSTDPKVVIEGIVTDQNEPLTVTINKTVNFSDANNYPAIGKAIVTIADNAGNSEVLTETITGTYKTKKLVGIVGRTYTLTVNAEGKTYTAKSIMSPKVNITDIKYEVAPRPGQKEDHYVLFPQFLDPKGTGNNYRFIQSTTKKMDKTIIISNDNVEDGKPNARPIFSQDLDILLGDTVTVEMHCIDKASYDYFYSLTQSADGGATPANPITNIQGGALGYFAAYTVQKLTKVVK
jgi:Domain of unknown function (DUF4249)